jgi:hypothetical protein
MANVVFVLGAGASKSAGAPVMSDFIRVATEIYRRGGFRNDGQHFERIERVRGELQRVHSKAQLDLDNVEELFSALEMAQMLRWLPGIENEDIDTAVASLRRVIVATLAQSIRYPFDAKSQRMLPPNAYGQFCDLLKQLSVDRAPRQTVAVITFNYDVAIDYALNFINLGPDYCLTESDGTGREIRLLKLHGSVNWGQCQVCSTVIPYHLKDYLKKSPTSHLTLGDAMGFNPSEKLSERSHCEKPLRAEPALIPPTWNKATSHTLFPSVWVRAGKELREAESVYVMGYSMPDSDRFFHYLYAIGLTGLRILDRFVVVDPDPSVHKRLRDLLGPSAQRVFRAVTGKFEESFPAIARDLGL